MDVTDQLKEDFEGACAFLRSVSDEVASQDLLYFYARFKQATEGPCNSAKPSFFDFQGKHKWAAWQDMGKKSREDSMYEYVTRMDELKPEWRQKVLSGEVKKKSGFGVSVSSLTSQEPGVPDHLKTIFDWCQQGALNEVKAILTQGQADVNDKDKEAMTLLHWACDRGDLDMVKLLVSHGADVNSRDQEGQTPLHYAVSCEHTDVIRYLLSCHLVDTNLLDSDGQKARELSDSPSISQLFIS